MRFFCGVDIIEVERIEKAIDKKGHIFRQRVFTSNEIEYCEKRNASKYMSYAARYAAKEAVSKALGTGFTKGINLCDIEIKRDEDKRPFVILHNSAIKCFEEINGIDISITLSHCKTYAVAHCSIVTE